jgi:hypothetical protein
MAFTKKPPVVADEAETPIAAPPSPTKKGKGKMPAAGASKPNWQKIAAAMLKK